MRNIRNNYKIDEKLRAAQIISDAMKILPASYTGFFLGFYHNKYKNNNKTRQRIREVFQGRRLDPEIIKDIETMTNELNA